MSCKRLQAVTIVDIATEWLLVVDAYQHFSCCLSYNEWRMASDCVRVEMHMALAGIHHKRIVVCAGSLEHPCIIWSLDSFW